LSQFRQKPAYDRTVEVSIYIHKDYRRRGKHFLKQITTPHPHHSFIREFSLKDITLSVFRIYLAFIGVGTVMMTEILARARLLGVHVVVGGITYGNEGSVKLMEKFGFTFVGTYYRLYMAYVVGYKSLNILKNRYGYMKIGINSYLLMKASLTKSALSLISGRALYFTNWF
jgi:GNAT superfamily N-acetyltransferase